MDNKYNDFATNFLMNIYKYFDRKYLNNKNAFTRKGKLSLEDTIKYPIDQCGHTNSKEANDYIKLITGDDYEMITGQAIGEKRGFIEPKVYEDMYKDYVDNFYDNYKEDITYKNRLWFAIDTTVIKVPNVSKCKEAFPVNEDNPARARLSTVADVFTGMIFTDEIVEKNHGEVKLAIKHLKELVERKPNRKMCVTYDRGYCAFDILFTHLYYGMDLLLRMDSRFLHKEIEQLPSDDEILRININNKKTNAISNPEIREYFEKEIYVDVRITKVEITKANGETYIETLLSTLPMEEFSKEELKELYGYRWEIETDYDRLKNVLELENFTGQRRIIIEQDIYSKIFILNLLLTIKIDADKYIQEKRKDKNLKHEYQANLNHLLGTMHTFLYKLIECKSEEEREMISNQILKEANQRLVLKKDDRIKDPRRHTGDTGAKHKSNDRLA